MKKIKQYYPLDFEQIFTQNSTQAPMTLRIHPDFNQQNWIGGKVRTVVLIGKDAPLLERLLSADVTCIVAQRLEQAVHIASSEAQAGDTVLLSPACASLDQFTDYQERGRVKPPCPPKCNGKYYQ